MDDVTIRTQYLDQIGHAGRVVRVLLAWLLSAIGWLYVGWGLGLIFFGPAAVLLVFAGGEAKSRGVVALCSLPTAIGLCLGVFSLVRVPSALPVTLGVAVAATVVAALVGGPKPRR